MMTLSKNKLSAYELSFLIMVIGLHIQAFYSGFQSTAAKDQTFYVFLASSALLFCQYVMRYIGIVHTYNSESTINAWIVSMLVFLMSYTLAGQIGNPDAWFICFALTSGCAVLKDIQCITALPNNPKLPGLKKDILIETAIIEAVIALLFLFIYFLSSTSLSLAVGNLDQATIQILGSYIAFTIIALFTIIIIRRAIASKSIIEDMLKETT